MSTAVDKEQLYGKYQAPKDRRLEWKDNLAKQAAHKALDIPTEDDTNINAPRTENHYGVNPKVAVIAAVLAAVLGGGALAGVNKLTATPPAGSVPAVPPAITAPAPAVKPQAFDAVYYSQVPAGTPGAVQLDGEQGWWQQTRREHLPKPGAGQ